MKGGDMMSINREKIVKEAKEIKDIEDWIGRVILEYIQENRDKAFSIEELMQVSAKKKIVLTWFADYAKQIVMRKICQFVKEGKIKAFDYNGQLLITTV
jgi:UV DNA damage repair endonuclease